MQNEWNDGFSLELLPSTNDGESDCTGIMFCLMYLSST